MITINVLKKIEDLMNGKDTVIEFTLDFIKKSK